MNYSMEDYLKVVAPHLHTDLVSPQALSHLQILAKFLPPFSYAGLECRLGTSSSPAVDLFISLPQHILNFRTPFLTNSVWQTLQTFHNEWVNSTSFQGVKDIALEFDVDSQPSQIPIPSLFVEFNQGLSGDDILALSNTILKQFKRPFSKKLALNFQRCIHALPKNARIIYLGIMLSRPTEAVRIVIEDLQPEQILEYLLQIDWFNPTDTLKTIIPTLENLVDRIGFLDIDVGETIHPQIGLECFFAKQPQHEARWQFFFDYLIEKGLCSPAKRDAMKVWPGFFQKELEPALWPNNLSWGDAFLGDKAVSVFFRKINHIKIVYQYDKPLEAKSYLAFGHRWLDRSTLTLEESHQKNGSSNHLSSKGDIEKNDSDKAIEQNTRQKVRNYYNTMNSIIVQDVGKTYQAGTLITDTPVDDPYRATNIYLASQAEIQAGQRILDAGCGAGGPSIDIAQHIENIKIDAITLSTAQAETAKELIQQAQLTDKIQVHVGDYHYLPFADETFDIVFFFESTGYSYDQHKLFAEVYRVLKEGGKLYIKDVFSKEAPLSEQEQQELAEFNQIYAQYQTPPLSQMITTISAAQFIDVTSRNIDKIMSTEGVEKAMYEYKHGFPFLTEFGKAHHRNEPFQCLPIFFAEIKARKQPK